MDVENLEVSTNITVPSDFREDIMKIYPLETGLIKITDGSAKDNHTATIRLKCRAKEEFIQWLKIHQYRSGVVFRVQSVKKNGGKPTIYKALYRCQHNTLPHLHNTKTPSRKHTGCAARLWVTIKPIPTDRRIRTKDILRMEYPTLITVSHKHNHAIHVNETEGLETSVLPSLSPLRQQSPLLTEDNNDEQDKVINTLNKIDDIQELFTRLLEVNSDSFSAAISSFHSTLTSISEENLIAALHSFGKQIHPTNKSRTIASLPLERKGFQITANERISSIHDIMLLDHAYVMVHP